jgi:hypothetical protein
MSYASHILFVTLSHMFCTPQIERYRGSSMFILNICKWCFRPFLETLIEMHIFRGSFSYISEFKTFLNTVYKVLIVLPSITKRGILKVHLAPLVDFGV